MLPRPTKSEVKAIQDARNEAFRPCRYVLEKLPVGTEVTVDVEWDAPGAQYITDIGIKMSARGRVGMLASSYPGGNPFRTVIFDGHERHNDDPWEMIGPIVSKIGRDGQIRAHGRVCAIHAVDRQLDTIVQSEAHSKLNETPRPVVKTGCVFQVMLIVAVWVVMHFAVEI